MIELLAKRTYCRLLPRSWKLGLVVCIVLSTLASPPLYGQRNKLIKPKSKSVRTGARIMSSKLAKKRSAKTKQFTQESKETVRRSIQKTNGQRQLPRESMQTRRISNETTSSKQSVSNATESKKPSGLNGTRDKNKKGESADGEAAGKESSPANSSKVDSSPDNPKKVENGKQDRVNKKNKSGKAPSEKVAAKKKESTNRKASKGVGASKKDMVAPDASNRSAGQPKIHPNVVGYKYAEEFGIATQYQLEKKLSRAGIELGGDLGIYRADRLGLIPHHGNRYVVLTRAERDELARKYVSQLPEQVHHIASNKNSRYTKQFEEIIDKYDLNLDGEWNKIIIPHKGRHPREYHEYVLGEMLMIDAQSSSKEEFLTTYTDRLSKELLNNPEIIRYSFYE